MNKITIKLNKEIIDDDDVDYEDESIADVQMYHFISSATNRLKTT